MRPRLIAVDDFCDTDNEDRRVYASMRPRLIAVDDESMLMLIDSMDKLQ